MRPEEPEQAEATGTPVETAAEAAERAALQDKPDALSPEATAAAVAPDTTGAVHSEALARVRRMLAEQREREAEAAEVARRLAAEIEIEPLFDRVLLREFEPGESWAAGIVKPDVAKDREQAGVVVSCGEGAVHVRVGDVVIYGKYAGVEVDMDVLTGLAGKNGKLYMLKEEEIFAIIRHKPGALLAPDPSPAMPPPQMTYDGQIFGEQGEASERQLDV